MNSNVPVHHAETQPGPRRTLTLTARRSAGFSSLAVHVNIDGRNHVVRWGTASFEIAADRPVTVSVYQIGPTTFGLATYTLRPEDEPVLEYRSPTVPSMDNAGLGAPGKVRRGRRRFASVVTILAMVVMCVVALLFVAVVAVGVL